MTFAIGKNVAIVYFAKSFLQMALTVDDSQNDQQSPNQDGEHNKIFPLKMEQFQPLNERQHFKIHSVIPNNYFNDAFLKIESILHPGYFLDVNEDEASGITVFLSHEKKNKTKWQFINGQLICHNKQSILIYDENDNYLLKSININNMNRNQKHISLNSDLYEESVFHLCFYDGNSIPEQVPILIYSPFFNMFITLIESEKRGNGGYWLDLENYDPYMPSQSWVFNQSHQNEIRSSVFKEQVFQYQKNNNYDDTFCTDVHNGSPNQQIKYIDYKLIITLDDNNFIVEYNNNQNFIMKEDENIMNDDQNKQSSFDIFDNSDNFIIFLSNQSSIFNFSPDLDSTYLYNPLMNQKTSWYSFGWCRGNCWGNLQNNSKYEEKCVYLTFDDDIKETIFIEVNVALKVSLLNAMIKNWKIFNGYLNDKISISGDQRILINEVQFSENTSITFSLIMKGEQLSKFKSKSSQFESIDDFEDLFDIYEDEEKQNPKFINDNKNRYSLTDLANNFMIFKKHHIKLRNNDEYDWQPKKPIYPDFMNLNIDSNDNAEINYFDKNIQSDDQFQNLLKGSSITITRDNSEQCRQLGYNLGITGMIDIANFVDSFSKQFAHLSDLAEIQNELMEINESNYESLAINFTKHIQKNNYSTICWIILSVSIEKPLENDNLAKFCKNLLQNQPPEFKKEFKKSIIRDFRSLHTNLYFYRKIYLYCEDLFTREEMKTLLKMRINNSDEIIFFVKEFPEFQSKENKINQAELDHYIEKGFSTNKLLKIIRDDDIDGFQKFFNEKEINVNKHIQRDALERIPLLKQSPTLLQYAAFFGSVKIVKYLILQNPESNDIINSCDRAKRNVFTFALAGGNSEVIHIIHQAQNQNNFDIITTDLLRNIIRFGQNDVLKWILTNTHQDIIEKLSFRELILEAILSKNINAILDLIEYIYTCESICIHFSAIFDNLEFLKLLYPFYIDNKFSLVCDAAISGNVDILKFLLEQNEEDINTKINLDNSLKTVAIRTAINNNNVDIFKYLAAESDYSYSNFIYACECNSLSIIKLFLSDENLSPSFNFSIIYIDDILLTFKLIISRKQDILNILLNSKFFDFNQKYCGYSLFYYAVKYKLFDFAKKIYEKQERSYDINEENILFDNINDSEIIRFLVSFHDLNVNMKDNKFKTAIEYLYDESNLNNQNSCSSILYLLDCPGIVFDPIPLLQFSINSNSFDIFEKVLQILSNKKVDVAQDQLKKYVDQIVKDKKNAFYIKIIKSGLVSIDENELVDQCIKLSNPKVYHEVINDKLPKEKEIQAVIQSLLKNDYDNFTYLIDIIKFDFNHFNDFLPDSPQTLLTFALQNTTNLEVIELIVFNKSVDINKKNEHGETPFSICIRNPNYFNSKNKCIRPDLYENDNSYKSTPVLFMKHDKIKFTQIDFETAVDNNLKEVWTFIIEHFDRFVDDRKIFIEFAFNNQLIDDLIPLLSNQDIFWLVLFYSVKYNMRSFFRDNLVNNLNEFVVKVENIGTESLISLCNAIYQKEYYFFDKLKIFHPLLLTIDYENVYQNSNIITPFGNARSYRIANEIITLLNKKNIPVEKMIKEICGLNIDGKTVLYTSIIENNYKLFNYLLELMEKLNQKLKEINKDDLIDALTRIHLDAASLRHFYFLNKIYSIPFNF